MNDVTYVEAARKLAERMVRENSADPLGQGFRLLLARTPTTKEREILGRTFGQYQKRYQERPADAEQLLKQGDSVADRSLPDLAAWTNVASILLNLDEAVTKP